MVGKFIVLTETIGQGCQSIYSDTIGKITEELDETHVVISFYPDDRRRRKSNVIRFKVLEGEEMVAAEKKYNKATRYNYGYAD